MRQIPETELFNESNDKGDLLRAEAILNQLRTILESRTFHAAQGQRTFLQYAVEQAVAGRGHLLKEYVIGVEALGRGDSFDPRLDPIVRTQARKLRVRLAAYYASEGAQDTILIDFPKGSYAPSFHRAEQSAAVVAPTSGEVSPAVAMPSSGSASPAPASLPASGIRWLAAQWRAFRWSVPKWSVPRWSLAAALLVIALLSALGTVALYRRSRANAAASEEASIAVMPLATLQETNADEYFSDGLTDDLIASLRTIPKLRVIAHASVFQFKNKSISLSEVDRKLSVRTVLLGAVRRSKDRLQVTLQLNSVPAGYHLWSGNYDRPSADLAGLESEIVRSISGVLGMSLAHAQSPELISMFSSQPLPNAHARESYFRGLQSWHKLTPEGLQSAIHFFQDAIAQDPSFARAYAALADCYVMAPQFGSARTSSRETASLIRRYADHALALDATLGDAHFDLAVSSEYAFDWATAEREFKAGLALSPANAVGHLWYAKYLALLGRKTEVLSHRRAAASLDPVSAYAAQSVAGYFSVVGLYDAAIAQFRTALSLEPGFGLAHQGLGFTYLLAGRRTEALAELRIADQLLAGPYREALLGYAYGVCGETQDARRILNQLLAQARNQPFPAVTIAHVYIGLGDKDRAFEWLAKAVDQRDLSVDLQWDPVYRTMRPDPRFAVLLHRMKLG